MPHEIERRTLGKVELRAADGEENGKKPRKMHGYAARFNEMSDDLGFREVILPGAFDRALRESHDVRALVNHNPDLILGRTGGNLTLAVDAEGLRVELDPLDTTLWRDTMANVEAGLFSQMSFAFRTVEDTWRTEGGEPVRELRDLELLDVSIVAYPAYPTTSVQVSARALDQARALSTANGPVPPAPEPEPTAEDPPKEEPAPEPAGVPNEINEARLRMSQF